MIIEVTSTNRLQDLGPKLELYEEEEVPEYVITDRQKNLAHPKPCVVVHKFQHGKGYSKVEYRKRQKVDCEFFTHWNLNAEQMLDYKALRHICQTEKKKRDDDKDRADRAESRADRAESKAERDKDRADRAESRADRAESEVAALKKKVSILESSGENVDTHSGKRKQEGMKGNKPSSDQTKSGKSPTPSTHPKSPTSPKSPKSPQFPKSPTPSRASASSPVSPPRAVRRVDQLDVKRSSGTGKSSSRGKKK